LPNIIYLMKNKPLSSIKNEKYYGYVCVMTHSFFNDIIKVGCTTLDPTLYAMALSEKTPGDYKIFFSLNCLNPNKVEERIHKQLHSEEYINEFYQVSAKRVESILKREVLRIPSIEIG